MSPVTITGPHAAALPERSTRTDPLVGFRNWRIYRDGPHAGKLSSLYIPVLWHDRTLRAECRRFDSAEDLLGKPHAAPDPDCGCGICAYHAPTGNLSMVDFRAVSGIVTVWGNVQADEDGMRAEEARVEALAVYCRWTTRQKQAVAAVGGDLGVDVIDLREIVAAAADYGAPLLAPPTPA